MSQLAGSLFRRNFHVDSSAARKRPGALTCYAGRTIRGIAISCSGSLSARDCGGLATTGSKVLTRARAFTVEVVVDHRRTQVVPVHAAACENHPTRFEVH